MKQQWAQRPRMQPRQREWWLRLWRQLDCLQLGFVANALQNFKISDARDRPLRQGVQAQRGLAVTPQMPNLHIRIDEQAHAVFLPPSRP